MNPTKIPKPVLTVLSKKTEPEVTLTGAKVKSGVKIDWAEKTDKLYGTVSIQFSLDRNRDGILDTLGRLMSAGSVLQVDISKLQLSLEKKLDKKGELPLKDNKGGGVSTKPDDKNLDPALKNVLKKPKRKVIRKTALKK
jgi:hypothetical protein